MKETAMKTAIAILLWSMAAATGQGQKAWRQPSRRQIQQDDATCEVEIDINHSVYQSENCVCQSDPTNNETLALSYQCVSCDYCWGDGACSRMQMFVSFMHEQGYAQECFLYNDGRPDICLTEFADGCLAQVHTDESTTQCPTCLTVACEDQPGALGFYIDCGEAGVLDSCGGNATESFSSYYHDFSMCQSKQSMSTSWMRVGWTFFVVLWFWMAAA